MRWRGIIGTCS